MSCLVFDYINNLTVPLLQAFAPTGMKNEAKNLSVHDPWYHVDFLIFVVFFRQVYLKEIKTNIRNSKFDTLKMMSYQGHRTIVAITSKP